MNITDLHTKIAFTTAVKYTTYYRVAIYFYYRTEQMKRNHSREIRVAELEAGREGNFHHTCLLYCT